MRLAPRNAARGAPSPSSSSSGSVSASWPPPRPRRQIPADTSAVASIVARRPPARRAGGVHRGVADLRDEVRPSDDMFLSAFASANPTAAEFELPQRCRRAVRRRARAAAGELLQHGMCRSRDVHFIRHAEGTHNLAEREATRDGLHKKNASWTALEAKHGVAWILTTEATGMAHYDAELTVAGARQAANLGAALQNSQQLVPLGYVGLEVDAVCSSPFVHAQVRANFARNFRAIFADGPPPPADRPPRGARDAREDRRDRWPADGGRPRAHARPRERPAARARRRVHGDGRLKVSDCESRLWQRGGRRRAGGRLRERGGRDVRERARGRARRGEAARGTRARPPSGSSRSRRRRRRATPRLGAARGRRPAAARRCARGGDAPALVARAHRDSASATSPRRRSASPTPSAARSRCASGRRRTGARRSCGVGAGARGVGLELRGVGDVQRAIISNTGTRVYSTIHGKHRDSGRQVAVPAREPPPSSYARAVRRRARGGARAPARRGSAPASTASATRRTQNFC